MRGLLAAALLVFAAAPAWAEAPPAVVYGVEIDVRGDRERLLVFASKPVVPEVAESEGDVLLVSLPRTVLDPSAPSELVPTRSGNVRGVELRESVEGSAPAVSLRIERRDAAAFEVEARGATLAISFARREPVAGEEVTLAFDSAPLAEIVEHVARATGERFIFDAGLEGRASVLLSEPVPGPVALGLLDSILHLQGFAAVQSPGGAYRIVPLAEAAATAPWRPEGEFGRGDAPVATAVRLRDASAQEVSQQLAPWVGQSTRMLAHPESNTLLLVGAEAHVRSLLGLVRAVDVGAGGEIWVRRLRHREAEAVAAQLQELLAGAPGRRRRALISADARADALVVVAPPEEMLEIRGHVAALDRRPPAYGELHVRRLRHADPVAMAELLESVAAGDASLEGLRARGLAGSELRAVVDRQSGALVVRSDAATYERVAALLDELDRPTPRIEVEVTLIEVMTSDGLDLGFDAFIPYVSGSTSGGAAFLNPSGGGLFSPGAGVGPAFGLRFGRTPIEIPLIGPGGVPINVLLPRETFVLTANEAFAASRVLQNPHLTLLAGEEQELFAGDNVPIPVAAAADAFTDPLTTRLDVQRYDVGVSLRVAATLGEAGRVRLELDVESSRVAAGGGRLNPTRNGPILEQRTVSTVVWLDDEMPALVGGADIGEMSTQDIGVPWLRDVPLLGFFLRSTRERSVKVQLVVAAQARVLRDQQDVAAASIRRRLGFERSLARSEALTVGAEPGWALRVATRRERADAEAIADHFALTGEVAKVASWRGIEGERHDVVLADFDTFARVNAAAAAARAAGFAPELIPLPAAAESH